VGAGAQLPVDRGDVLPRRSGRAPGAAAMGAGARVPVGLEHLLVRGPERAPGGIAVVGRCRLTVSKPEFKARLVSALETKM
jgi:hypothetical protein